jgi:hypothetical protein
LRWKACAAFARWLSARRSRLDEPDDHQYGRWIDVFVIARVLDRLAVGPTAAIVRHEHKR